MLQQQILKQQEDLRIVSEQLALLQQMEALSQVPDSAVVRGTFNASDLAPSKCNNGAGVHFFASSVELRCNGCQCILSAINLLLPV